ncbi:uncharacterized protein LOC135388391 isoform X1 [Ornithodoros turicata]|uniref:uncharacterized protein LOC135388391 isoform X1 n=1 Tax=Ornithodoros turicata TaxID=34597 RepID=UPI0031392DC8
MQTNSKAVHYSYFRSSSSAIKVMSLLASAVGITLAIVLIAAVGLRSNEARHRKLKRDPAILTLDSITGYRKPTGHSRQTAVQGRVTAGRTPSTTTSRTTETAETANATKQLKLPAVKANPILCTTDRLGETSRTRAAIDVDLPDGICDILVLDYSMDDILNHNLRPTAAIKALEAYSRNATLTKCGVNFDRKIVTSPQTLKALIAEDQSSVLHNLWENSIIFYGVLDGANSNDTVHEADEILGFFKEIVSFKSRAFADPVYSFAGIKTFRNASIASTNILVSHVQQLFSQAKLDILVYQTTYRGDIECMITGPTPWAFSNAQYQPSLKGAQRLRKEIILPPGKVEMFAVTLCGIFTDIGSIPRKYREVKTTSGGACGKYRFGLVTNWICQFANTTNSMGFARSERQVHEMFFVRLNGTFGVAVYDTSSSLEVKICRAKSEFDFQGGWVVRDLQCSFPNVCDKSKTHQGRFQRVRAVREIMTREYFNNTCPEYKSLKNVSNPAIKLTLSYTYP